MSNFSLSSEDMQTMKMALRGWVNMGLDEIARREFQFSTLGPMTDDLTTSLKENIAALKCKVEAGSDLLRRLAD